MFVSHAYGGPSPIEHISSNSPLGIVIRDAQKPEVRWFLTKIAALISSSGKTRESFINFLSQMEGDLVGFMEMRENLPLPIVLVLPYPKSLSGFNLPFIGIRIRTKNIISPRNFLKFHLKSTCSNIKETILYGYPFLICPEWGEEGGLSAFLLTDNLVLISSSSYAIHAIMKELIEGKRIPLRKSLSSIQLFKEYALKTEKERYDGFLLIISEKIKREWVNSLEYPLPIENVWKVVRDTELIYIPFRVIKRGKIMGNLFFTPRKGIDLNIFKRNLLGLIGSLRSSKKIEKLFSLSISFDPKSTLFVAPFEILVQP